MIENTARITASLQRIERLERKINRVRKLSVFDLNLILDLNWILFSHQLKPTKTHPKKQCLQIPCLSPEVKVQMTLVNRCPLKLIIKNTRINI